MVSENGKIINSMNSKILAIAGDASFRKFYRIISKKKNQIAVFAEKEKYKNLIAYTAINAFLKNNKIIESMVIEEKLKIDAAKKDEIDKKNKQLTD